MRQEWQGKWPEGIGRLWSYGLKFEEWAAQVREREVQTCCKSCCRFGLKLASN